MSLAKSGAALFALLIAFSFSAYGAESELQGYTPPPMFGGTSTPLSPPVAAPKFEVPAETPAKEAAPVKPKLVPKPSSKIVTPPKDKEAIIVKDTPLPIKPLTPRAPTKSTVPPADKEKVPAYVPPKANPKPVETVKAQPPSQPATTPAAPAVNTGISAESLLNHAVTSENTAPVDDNPLAVPVGKIDEALPLPGSVPPSKKSADKKKTSPKTPEKKVADKKTETKKAEKKSEPKKPVETAKKPEPKKTETAKAEPRKPEVKKPEPKKVEAKKEEPKKPIEKPVEAAKKPEPAKVAPAPKLVETTPELPLPSTEKIVAPKPKPVEDKAYNVKGRKSMPTAMPTKVEKVELDEKSPLPPTDASPSLKSEPSINERIIDHALEERLVEPDVKTISKAAPAAKNSKATDDGFINPKPKNPPPLMFRNNTGEDNPKPTPVAKKKAAPAAPAKEKVKPQLVSVEFKEAATDVTDDMKNIVNSSLIAKLKADSTARLQILAYASPTKDGQSSARRISLARGLALRAYMLEKGVAPDRIDIRALGENTTEKPLDRADLMIISYK